MAHTPCPLHAGVRGAAVISGAAGDAAAPLQQQGSALTTPPADCLGRCRADASTTTSASSSDLVPPQRCPACGHALSGTSRSLVEEVHAAVASAFAELRPALLEALATRDAGETLGTGSRAHPTPPVHLSPNIPSQQPPMLGQVWCSSRSDTAAAGSSDPSPTRLAMPALSSQSHSAAVTSTDSGGTTSHRGVTKSPSVSSPGSAGRPLSVQALQSGLADAVLEQAGMAVMARGQTPGGRRASMTLSVATTPRQSVDRSVSLGRFVRVVPSSDGEPGESWGIFSRLAERRVTSASTTPRGSVDRSGSLGHVVRLTSSGEGGEGSRSSNLPAVRLQPVPADSDDGSRDFDASRPCSSVPEDSNGSDAGNELNMQQVMSWRRSALLRWTPRSLMAFGILPWDRWNYPTVSKMYQRLMKGVLGMSFLAYLALAAQPVFPPSWRQTYRPGSEPVCWQNAGFLSQTVVAVGALMSLIPFAGEDRQHQLEATLELLCQMCGEHDCEHWHLCYRRRDAAIFVLIWTGIVASTTAWASAMGRSLAEIAAAKYVVHTLLTAVFAGSIASFSHGIVFMIQSLGLTIDAFCCEVVDGAELEVATRLWNVTQSVLRKVSDAVERSLMFLVILLVFMVSTLLIDMFVWGIRVALVPNIIVGILLSSGISYLLFLTASITERCKNVPPLVNATDFGPGTTRDRQDVVDYITSSAAGFYVCGVRLTTAMVFKFMYVCCIVVLSFLTRMAASSNEVAGPLMSGL
eukprot:CAMPEP_0176015608 /NCGR_PEP_ID=MMETSP0120_2-20121206/7425_1 /TAXON_ID=160619 /ORGANISM="Kryptoperidinium foliaceum, Strain CCMP 1326" /LENGTH=747 /DNA_ID=CAMNT_0017348583 /DNA_START=9 /DNA_END=2253 /DNA_ORIENTATION=-